MTDRKLGARKAVPEKLAKTLKAAHYFDLSQCTEFIPPEFDHFINVPDSVDLNDTLGICVVAAEAKHERSWTQNATGTACSVTNAQLLDVYKLSGYDPNDPSTDQGWDLLTALGYWQKLGIAGRKIGAYVAINPKHHMMVRAASYLFGGIYIALALPSTAQDETVWSATSAPLYSWGGHCVTQQAVLADRPVCRTWGYAQPMTWAFWDKYCTEAYAIISPDYLNGGKTISGLDSASLAADLQIVRA